MCWENIENDAKSLRDKLKESQSFSRIQASPIGNMKSRVARLLGSDPLLSACNCLTFDYNGSSIFVRYTVNNIPPQDTVFVNSQNPTHVFVLPTFTDPYSLTLIFVAVLGVIAVISIACCRRSMTECAPLSYFETLFTLTISPISSAATSFLRT